MENQENLVKTTEVDRCVFCLEPKRSPVAARCGHTFCRECFNEFKSYHKANWVTRCPICRTSLKISRGAPYSIVTRTQRVIGIIGGRSTSQSARFHFHIGINNFTEPVVVTAANTARTSTSSEGTRRNNGQNDANASSSDSAIRFHEALNNLFNGRLETEQNVNNDSDVEEVSGNATNNTDDSRSASFNNDPLAHDHNYAPISDPPVVPDEASATDTDENSEDDVIEIVDSDVPESIFGSDSDSDE